MKIERTVKITTETGDSITVPLFVEGEREGTMLMIDDVRYHFERLPREQLVSEYRVDSAPDFQPQADDEDCCYILAPFSQ